MTDSGRDFDSALQAALDRVSAARRAHLANHPETDVLAEGVERLLAGGKRLRPAFLYAGYLAIPHRPEHSDGAASTHSLDADGGRELDAIATAGAALELFQAAALIHDDLIDASPLRRGIPATHRFLAEAGPAAGTERSAAFGGAAAILLGDLVLIESEATYAAAASLLSEGRRAAALQEFWSMCREVTVGQYLDIAAENAPWGDPAADRERARRVIHAKSASYSVRTPVRLGAMSAGASAAQLDALTAYGAAIGEAFQLRDDLLGVFGNVAATGKPAGDDVREGKRTVLVHLALERLASPEADELRAGIGHRDLSDDDVARLAGLIESSGAVAASEVMIATCHRQALEALAACPLAPEGRTRLEELAREALHRQT